MPTPPLRAVAGSPSTTTAGPEPEPGTTTIIDEPEVDDPEPDDPEPDQPEPDQPEPDDSEPEPDMIDEIVEQTQETAQDVVDQGVGTLCDLTPAACQ